MTLRDTILLKIIKFCLPLLLPRNNFLVLAMDPEKHITTAISVRQQNDGSYSHSINYKSKS